ncbi:putative MAPEG superfamily protein related to glutathione S-transferase [Shewanella psychrophila]|uniref:Putative MAPEG superfamily protein related to glutathione S-transferase n=1 Tax=Shewanella psychrophila TaxID=225848 RepID=A0A1S6HSD3_9GAMM|nr:MAPEG family protein [Shewanella psychrophila]AQS38394.1 putative MAPEG superfamily protein related to glutathione S-transferase [Shewanella psychrophila]
MSVVISGLYISLTAILVVALAMRVVKLRRKHKIGLGSADNKALELATRVHANLVENAPIAMILLLLAELNDLSGIYLHLLGIVWIIGRILHAVGLTQGKGGYHLGRFWGGLLSWSVILILAIFNITHFVLDSMGYLV